ncbi:MAG TPA: phosphoribosylglycinamide formyltransferase [Xanthobacteraceae bacterium]|nr:phosphoribosylglycinamide formyltransferase [Xanthobacteraceae bacterium]
MAKRRVGILISGRGSNMAALIEAARAPDYPAEVVVVISNEPDAAGLAFAATRGVPTAIVNHRDFASRDAFADALDAKLRAAKVEIVCLAGFMRLLATPFVERWRGRMINIHPSLLPAFKGLNTHARALDAGAKTHGCTVHYVEPELDSGPVILQAEVPVLPGDDEATLAARVLKEEHRLYPAALRLVAEGRDKS